MGVSINSQQLNTKQDLKKNNNIESQFPLSVNNKNFLEGDIAKISFQSTFSDTNKLQVQTCNWNGLKLYVYGVTLLIILIFNVFFIWQFIAISSSKSSLGNPEFSIKLQEELNKVKKDLHVIESVCSVKNNETFHRSIDMQKETQAELNSMIRQQASDRNDMVYLLRQLSKLQQALKEKENENILQTKETLKVFEELRKVQEELDVLKELSAVQASQLDSAVTQLSTYLNSTARSIRIPKTKATFVWKLEEFNRLLSIARTERQKTFLSNPFFTDDGFGYKLRLKIYPNGFANAEGNYTSIFIGVEEGEMDSILNWPFSYTTTIVVFNREYGKNYEVTFTEENSSCGALIVDSACGWPKFISHDDIFKNGFLIKGALYVKAIVKLVN